MSELFRLSTTSLFTFNCILNWMTWWHSFRVMTLMFWSSGACTGDRRSSAEVCANSTVLHYRPAAGPFKYMWNVSNMCKTSADVGMWKKRLSPLMLQSFSADTKHSCLALCMSYAVEVWSLLVHLHTIHCLLDTIKSQNLSDHVLFTGKACHQTPLCDMTSGVLHGDVLCLPISQLLKEIKAMRLSCAVLPCRCMSDLAAMSACSSHAHHTLMGLLGEIHDIMSVWPSA